MVKKYKVQLELEGRELSHEVNCANEDSARCICEGIYPKAEVKSIVEVAYGRCP